MQFIKVLLIKLSDMLHSSNFVRLFHCQSFMLYGNYSINNTSLYSIHDIHTSLMKLVKEYKVYQELVTAKEYIIKYATWYLSSQRLTEVDASSHKIIKFYLKLSVINHKNVSKPEMKPCKHTYTSRLWIELIYTVVWKIFVWNYFVAKNTWEKNFSGFPVPMKIFKQWIKIAIAVLLLL